MHGADARRCALTRPEFERRCREWEQHGERLRAAVAWRVFQGKADVLSAVTGVPMDALKAFVNTGELAQPYRMMLEVMS